jgi:hypothetical protein
MQSIQMNGYFHPIGVFIGLAWKLLFVASPRALDRMCQTVTFLRPLNGLWSSHLGFALQLAEPLQKEPAVLFNGFRAMALFMSLTLIMPLSANAASSSVASALMRPDNDVWARLLTLYRSVDETGLARFDYGALKANADDRAALDAYVASYCALDPASLDDNDRFAALANLYNAATVKLIVDNYPISSIRQIKPNAFAIGPWKMKIVPLDGGLVSLDNIEHDMLRKDWDEPRVHYAVNCASIGCPNLGGEPLTGEGLDDALDQAARAFVNSSRGLTRRKDGRLVVSRIYDWFSEDFGGSDAGVRAHLAIYAKGQAKAWLEATDGSEVRGLIYDYDWTLNDASNKDAGE